jgi:tRNA(Ile)-lysidine synthase
MNDLDLELSPGIYVLAVSGGVDSIVLMHQLANKPDIKLIVAHFDHGIRANSEMDRILVQQRASQYGLPFVYDQINLGAGASEAVARAERYKFLRKVMKATNANAIITAHHQDDVIETAILNLIRGTNRKGLSSLKSIDGMIRPLSNINKNQIYSYAKNKNLNWNEDITNEDLNYKRNYVRHKIVTKFDQNSRVAFVKVLNDASKLNDQIDEALNTYISDNSENNILNRHAFIILPHNVAIEIMASWLRRIGIRNYDSKTLEKLTIGAKTLKTKQRMDVNIAYYLEINQNTLALKEREC